MSRRPSERLTVFSSSLIVTGLLSAKPQRMLALALSFWASSLISRDFKLKVELLNSVSNVLDVFVLF